MALSKEDQERIKKRWQNRNNEDSTTTSGGTSSGTSLLSDSDKARIADRWSKRFDVDDTYINTFISDATSFLNKVQTDYKKLDWQSATAKSSESYYSSMRKTESDLSERAGKIKNYLNAHKDEIDEETYNGLSEYLNQFSRPQFSQQFYDAKDYYSQWETEEDYNSWLDYQKEYEAKLNFDVDAGQKEVDALKAVREEYDHLIVRQSTANPESEANIRLREIRSQYGSKDDIDALISEKEAYLTQSKRLKEGVRLSSVNDPNSENYDPDFGKYSGYVSTEYGDGLSWDKIFGNQYGLGYGDLTYEYINNQNGIREDIKRKASVFGKESGDGESQFEEKGYDYLTEDETAIYNYYYAKDGKEAAEKYLDSIQEHLNARKATGMFKNMEDNTLLELAFGVAAGLDQFESGMEGLWNSIVGNDEYVAPSATQMASGMVREDLADVGPKLPDWLGGASFGQAGYDAVTTTSNMLPSIMTSTVIGVINPVAGSAVGTSLLGASAGGNAYQEMINLGYSKNQARAYGVLVGGAEAGLQYLLGGISKLGGNVSGNMLTKVLNGVDNAFARTAIKLGGNMLSEGFEEGIQEILTPWFKNLAVHTNEDVNWSDVAYSTLLGAITAGFMEGGSTISGEVNTYKTGKQLQAADISATRLAELGQTFSADTVAYQLAGRVNENTGAYTMGRLFNEIGATLTEQNVNEIANALEAKGMDAATAKKNAKALAYVVEGGQLSDRQIAAIEANEVLAEVARTTLIDANTTWNQRSRGYNEMLQSLANEMTATNTSRTNPAQQTQENAPVSDTVDAQNKNGTEAISEAEKVDTSPAKVKSISTIKNGQVTIKLEDGTEVNVRDADLSPDDGVRIETIASIDGISTEDANFILNTLRTSTNASAQMDSLGAKEIYKYGFYGFSQDHIAKHGVFANSLSEDQRNAIYATGQNARMMQVVAKQATVAKKGATVGKAVGKVHFDGDRSKLTDRQRVSLSTLETVADALGVQVYVFESQLNERGKRIGANGWYDPKDSSIHIDLHAGANGEGTMLFTAAHELTHHIRKWSPEKFKTLSDFLMQEYGKKGVNVDGLVRAQIAKAKRGGRTISYDTAYEEVVADSMEQMLSDGNVIKRLEKLKAQDKDLWHKIKRFIDDLAAKIRSVYKVLAPDSDEALFVADMGKAVYRLQELFAEGLVDASENYQSSLTPGEEGVVVNESGDPVAYSTEDGSLLLSMRTYEEDGRKAFRDYLNKCVSSKKLTEAEMQEMLEGIEDIYQTCKEFKDKYAPFSAWSDAAVVRDTHGKPVFSVVTPNGDYKMNLDFSLVCKKRRTLDAVFNEMSKRGIIDDFELGQKSVVKINEIIRKYGLETACALCFVDAKRFRQASMADSFTRLYNELVESLVPEDQKGSIDYFNFSGYATIKKVESGIDTWENSKLDFSHINHVLKTYGSGTVEYKAAQYIKTHAEGRKLLLRGDFMSSQGFDAVKSQNQDILKLYNSKKGTGGPKAAFGDVQYMNEIVKKARTWTPEKAYAVGGVRIQSFSDYVPRMVFDYVQMVYDLAATKLPAHAYTKEALFVKQFGLTGIKINMSLIPAIAEGGIAPGLDANGNYVWAGESFDFETAKEIQNAEGYTENCGTICVGVSYKHIIKLLGDPDIRMVIPYHKSGLNPIVAHMNKIAEFTDYTTLKTNPGGCQNTMDKNGNKVETDFNFNEVLRKTGDPKATVRQYLNWCAKNEYTPRFAEFAWHENYYKLIEDFTLYDKDGKFVPQREVRAVFPKADSAFGSMKDLIQEGLQEDAIVEGKRDKSLSSIVDEIQKTLPKTEAEIAEEQVEQADRDLEAMGVLYSSRDVTSWDINWDEDNHSSIKSQMVKHMADINRMNPVADIEFDKSKGKTYANILDEVLRTKFGYKIDRADGASFLFDKVAIATLRRYVTTDEEAAAVTAAPYVLKRGKAISGHKNHKGNRYPSVTYAAPVTINGERVNVGVVVLFGDKNRPHSLRVLMPSGKEYVMKKTEADSGRRWALPDGSVRSSTESASEKNVAQTEQNVKKYSDRDNAPTFYSLMAKVVDGLKQDKFGAASLVSTLTNRGVKAEEIKWSGIEEWLNGKKSVTKAELQEFIAGSMLQIEEEVLDNKDRPYTEDQQKRLDEYEAKRDEIAKRLADEWKKITGEEFPIRNTSAGLESAVSNAIIDANKDHKDASFEGRLLKKLRKDLDKVIENNDDFGFDSRKDALRSIHRHRRDFISYYEMSTNDKAVIVKYCNALNAYNELSNRFSDEDTDRLRAIARETDPWNRKIMEVKHEHNEEEAKFMTKWREYSLKGGKNYREVLFRIPDSSYSNSAMYGHWEGRRGVLAHARIQDMDTPNGKMLFIDEIQSDWHNQGHKEGYRKKDEKTDFMLRKESDAAYKEFYTTVEKMLEDNANWEDDNAVYYAHPVVVAEMFEGNESHFEQYGFTEEQRETIRSMVAEEAARQEALKTAPKHDTAPDAPFKDTYHEYVLKRLLRMAAEEGYDSVGWTPAATQMDRWNPNRKTNAQMGITDAKNHDAVAFEEAYRNLYDRRSKKFLENLGDKWGATVGKTTLDNGTEVWSMAITDEMKDSVMTEGQPLYSDRDTESVSNRSLLANALEGATKNDIEKQKIQEYKGKIDLINAEEQKLQKLNEQIKELSFSKGPRDTKAIRDLQFEAKQTANRISTYDKQLLRLEASKPLQDVLTREKKMAYKRAEQKGKEALAAYKEKATKTQRELLEKWQASRKNAVESRNKTAMKHKIQSVVGELNQLLLSNDKKRHVPDSLKKAVADALSLVNMDTVAAEERAAKYAALIAKETDPDKIDAYTVTMENILKQGEKMGQRLKELRDAYEEIQNSDDPDIANAYDPVIAGSLNELAQSIGNTSLRDMTIEQLSDVYDMYKMVLTRVRDANKSFLNEKKEAISNLASRVVGEVRRAGGEHKYRAAILDPVRGFFWNNAKPVYAMEHIGSETMTDAYNNVRKGEDTWAKDVTEARAYYIDKSKKYGYDSWDFKKKYTFESTSEQKFELTLEQILSLYAYSKREQAHDHLRLGGFVFDSNIETYKDKGSKLIKYKVNTADAHQITPEILANITGTLTKEQMAFVDEMQDYLSTVMGTKGNEVTMAMYGVKLFKEKFYFPLKSAKQFMFEQNEVSGEVKIKNSGFTNKVVAKANNPVILSNFMDVWANHVNDMSMYHSFVLPLEDFNRIFNYNSPKQEGTPPVSVKGTIQSAYSPAAVSYVKQLITDLNGGAMSDPRETIAKSLMAKFKKAKVFSSLSVVIQQPSAIGRAFALVDPKYFHLTKDGMNHDELWAELKQYAPVAIIKEMGYFDTNMGKSTQDFIKAKEYTTFKEKAKAVFTDGEYRDELLSKAPALADELTWCAIWNAVKRETAAKHKDLKPGSEEFLKAAGERFTEVVTKTQVYDSVLARSANMRSKGGMMSMITSFMAEPTTSINMLEDAIRKGKMGYKGYAARAFASVAVSVILNNALVSLVYGMRDDDEDETFAEKYMQAFVSGMMDDVNPLTYYPFVKDMWSVLQGYDVERSDMSLVSDLADAMKSMVKAYTSEDGDISEAWWTMAGSIANIGGVPMQNIRRDVNGAINFFNTIIEDVNGRDTTGLSMGDALEGAVKDSLPVVGWFPGETKADKLYDAIISGDTAYVNRLKGSYVDKDGKFDQSKYDTAVRKALRENDPRIKEAAEARFSGDFSGYKELFLEIKGEGLFTFDQIMGAINAEVNDLEKKANGDTAETTTDDSDIMFKVEHYYTAVTSNNKADAKLIYDELIAEKLADGYLRHEAEDAIATGFATQVGKDYMDGEISRAMAVRLLEENTDKGETDVKKWDFELEYGFSWGERVRKYRLGQLSKRDLIDAVMDIEGEDRESAEAYIAFLDLERANGNMDITANDAAGYFEYAEPAGIDIDVYLDYKRQAGQCESDRDANGKPISGSKKKKILAVIDSLNITRNQKDALYYANGYSESTLYEAPWH